jgi:N-ethylmaleimide reductase
MKATNEMKNNTTASLLSIGQLGRYELPTRMIMAPMTRMRAHGDGVPSDMMVTYYSQRACAALIISEATAVSAQGVGYMNAPRLYTEEHVRGWARVTSAVHARGGRIFVQLFHAGRISHPSLLPGTGLPVAPSAIRPKGRVHTPEGRVPYVTPRCVTDEEIPRLVDEFKVAAQLAAAAGFDGAEIHAANGYLLDQFLRNGANHRQAPYGGSPKNRARFLTEVADAVASVLGAGSTGVRLSPLHRFNDMSDSEPRETFTTAVKALDKLGLAYLHLVEKDDAPLVGPRFELSRLRALWSSALVVNEDYDRVRAAAALARGADFISFGKLFIANPDLPRRFLADARLNSPRSDSFYGGDSQGYIDYPFLSADDGASSCEAQSA